MFSKKNIESAIKYLIYITFFIPLVVVPSSYIFPFIVPKVLLFRSIVILMLGGYILLVLINKKEYFPKFTVLNILLSLFLVSFIVSTFWGVDPYHSFWDNHERMLGLFTIFHYIIYYFICSAIFKNWKDWSRALKIFLVAGSIVMFTGLLQVVNPNLLLNQGSVRVGSTLGNAIYVGGYGLFLIFIAYLLYVKEESKVWRYLEVFLAILALGGMFYSGTRGSLLGLASGFLLGSVLYLVLLKNHQRVRLVIGISLMLGAAVVSFLFLYRKTDFVSGLPAIGRMLNTTAAEYEEGPRAIAWKIAIESWKEKPIIGWGPNNFFYAFNKHYNPRSLEYTYGETWFDNAHNIILNTLSVQGLFGLVSYLAIFIGSAFVLTKAYRQKNIDIHFLVIGNAFLFAHLIQNITVFENPTSYLYFMFWLAMINSIIKHSQTASISDQKNPLDKDRKIGVGVFLSTGLLVFLLIFVFNIQPARANKNTLMALSFIENASVDQSIVQINNALNFDSPHIDDIRGDIGRSVLSFLSKNIDKLKNEDKNKLINTIYPVLKQNLILHPLDIRTHIVLSELMRLKAIINNSNDALNEGEFYLGEALKISPRRQQLLYALTDFKVALNKDKEAISLVQQAISDDPKIAESYLRMAYIYLSQNDVQKAKEILNDAKIAQAKFDSDEEVTYQNLMNRINSSSTSALIKTTK
jgi:O-antigen ligase